MRKLLLSIISILLILSMVLLSACGGDGKKATEPASKQDARNTAEARGTTTEPKSQTGQTEKSGQDPQTENTGTSAQTKNKDLVVYESYSSFFDAKTDFLNLVLDEISPNMNLELSSKLHEVTVQEAVIFIYLTPLIYIGQSKSIHGRLVIETDEYMLKQLWGEDAVLTYDEKTGYYAKGKDVEGNVMEYNILFNPELDSLKMEVSKNGTRELVFEYSYTGEGYAAQYTFETITRYENFSPIYEKCTFRTIFHENGGSCARFDGVSSWPDSIYEKVPEESSFIKGASHWYSVKGKDITGNIGGKELKTLK
jgi:hypothetical protein